MPVDHSTVKDLLEAAYKAVTEAAIPEPLQDTALSKSFDFLAGSSTMQQPVGQAQTPTPTPPSGGDEPSLDNIAARLKVGRDVIDHLYDVENNDLRVVVAPSKLESAKRGAMRQVILLTALGRQAGKWDKEGTPLTALRGACEAFGNRVYDSNNFMNALNDQSDYLRKTGTGKKDMAVKVTPTGYEQGTAFITNLAGGDQK